MAMLVEDVMSSPVVTIDKNKSVKAVGKLMKKARRGAVVVLDKRKPIGIVTDSDLVKRIVATGLNSGKVKVREIMSKPIVTVSSGENVLTAVRKMKKINVHRLPVTDKGRLVGLISLTDVAKVSPEMVDILEYRMKMREEEPLIKTETTAGICESCEDYSDRLKHTGGQWICKGCEGDLEEE